MGLLPTAAALTERLLRTLRRHKLIRAWMALTDLLAVHAGQLVPLA